MKYFEYFSDQEVEEIHRTTLRVLQEVGVVFSYEPALQLLKKAGCKVDGEKVYFPSRLVEEQVAKAPSRFTLHGRNPERNVVIGGDGIAYIPCYGSPFIHDLDNGRRPSNLQDYINFVKLGQSSSSMDITGGVMAEPNDVPHQRRNAEMMYASMRYSDKPFMGGAIGVEAARETIQMASLVFGSEKEMAEKPPFVSILCSHTPLGYDDRMLGAIMEYAKAGMPQLISSLAIAGATAPVTLEGTLVVQNAEVLAGITLAQLVREGAPVVFAGSSSATAMRYGTLSIGAPEMAVNTAATAQMGRFYHIPTRGGGAVTDSKIPDAQSAFESMMSQLMATLSGVHFVLHSAGILESYLTASYEKFVIDDEICGMCKRIKKGEQVTEERLAFEMIKEVGPGGEYLTHKYTFQNCRKEFYAPIMEQRDNFEGWTNKGGLSMEQVANAKWKKVLADYKEPLLPESEGKALEKYMEKVRAS
jgi:trimethylamine--corrinoid protein Co-methyltransferase